MSAPSSMPADGLAEQALVEMDDAVTAACESGSAGGLSVLGSGEISLVVGWPPGSPVAAAKRLPTFPDLARFEDFQRVFDAYVAILRNRRVSVVESRLWARRAADRTAGPRPAGNSRAGNRAAGNRKAGDTVQAYCLQPVLPADHLASVVLERDRPDAGHPVLSSLLDAVGAVVDERVGFDAQVSNWMVEPAGGERDGTLVYLDVTTPLLRDAAGRPELDVEVFLAALPPVFRPPVRRWMVPGIIAKYHDPGTVVLDTASNLIRQGLSGWVPPLLRGARERLDVRLSEDDVRRDYRSEARTWQVIRLARRVDRQWQRHIRRRPYPHLVPEATGW